MKRRDALCLLAAPTAWAQKASAPAQLPAFSRLLPGQTASAGWAHQTLPRIPQHNQFDVLTEEARPVLRVRSRASTSSWIAALDADPEKTPILQWRWKVAKALEESDLLHKETDDFAARVYVFFAVDESTLSLGDRLRLDTARALSGSDIPAAAVCYVWGKAQPVGTRAWNPYTNRLRMITVDSGNELAQQWQVRRRNVAADYLEAFGGPVPRISAVGVGADTDNTKTNAEAWFAELRLLPG
jgi:outer membrane protein OmpA-like peptidoglycan-associated protein